MSEAWLRMELGHGQFELRWQPICMVLKENAESKVEKYDKKWDGVKKDKKKKVIKMY